MYINAVADHLTDLFICGRTIVRSVNGDEASIVVELLEPFLKAYDCYYECIESDDGESILLEANHRAVFEHIANYLHELLENDYSEMDNKQYHLIARLLRDVKCSFESAMIKNDHWWIRIYM